jgi:DNA-binding response OmpR family regulator
LKKILIVDDERFIRILLEETLGTFREAGVKILTAKDGNEALQLAMLEEPDLVILDIMMPRLDGYEVCRRLRRDLGLDDAYVIMLTAKGQSADRLRGLQLGANEYLTKPFDPDYLVTRAADLLQIDL